MNDTLRVRVGRIEQLAAGIKRFTLQPCDGDALPASRAAATSLSTWTTAATATPIR